VENVDNAGAIAIVGTARGNICYQYLENQLRLEQSWGGFTSQKIPRVWWNAKVNYHINIIHISCIQHIFYVILKNAFSVDWYLNCFIT
jgi:hypothetical protein